MDFHIFCMENQKNFHYYNSERAKNSHKYLFFATFGNTMVTYMISKDCISLLCAEINPEDVRNIVSSCLELFGYESWPAIEAELFSLDGRSLMIARRKD